jgi:hypothetical protein
LLSSLLSSSSAASLAISDDDGMRGSVAFMRFALGAPAYSPKTDEADDEDEDEDEDEGSGESETEETEDAGDCSSDETEPPSTLVRT